MKKTLLGVVLIAAAITSCCRPCTASAPKIGDLEQATWTLIELNNNPVENSPVTLKFSAEEKMVYGTALCNNFFAGYNLLIPTKKDRQNVRFLNVGATRKLCPDMEVEQAFTAALPSVTRLRIEGEHLLMINRGDSLVAVFTRAKMQ